MANAPSTENETVGEGEAPAKRSSLVPKLLVGVLVLGVIGTECGVAYLCLPSPVESAAMAGVVTKPNAPAKAAEKEAAAVVEEKESTGGEIEVDLGEFCVTSYQPASNMTLRIDFHLFGSVTPENEKDFKRLYDENKNRIREQVLMTVRGADISDLTDAGLGLVKRTILDKVRRTLGKPLLRELIISDYSFIEQ